MSKTLIFFFLSKNTYATSDTIASYTLPILFSFLFLQTLFLFLSNLDYRHTVIADL